MQHRRTQVGRTPSRPTRRGRQRGPAVALVAMVLLTLAPGSSPHPAAAAPVAAPGRTARAAAIPADDLACFVDGVHQVFLRRPSTADDVRVWLGFFGAGIAVPFLPSALARSNAWLTEEVRVAYRIALDRAPDPGGLRYWTGQLGRGQSVRRITAQIYGSAEFFARAGGTNEAFVRRLYLLILHRPVDPAGLRHWLARIRRAGRGRVAAEVFDSIESRRDRVARLYDRVLDRAPDASGLRYWAGQFTRINDVDLAAALSASDEFLTRSRARCAVPLTVANPELPPARAGSAFQATLQAVRGTPPISWAVTGLPPGLRLSGDRISGTPTAPGRFDVRMTATDAVGGRSAHTLPLVVGAPRRPGGAAIDGYGAWIDVYDWTHEYTNGRPPVTVATIDEMRAEGVDTLYIQTARRTSASTLVEEARARSLIARAKSHGMSVVAWYLPTFVDPDVDVARLVASARLPVDAIGVDIESSDVRDPDVRSQRLLQVSARLRAATSKPVIAIVPSPVAMDDISPSYWPRFPWRQLRPSYDAWMPMAYWSYRPPGSHWHDGYRYTLENVRRIRSHISDPDAYVHPIGSPTAPAHIDGMVRAIRETRSIGGSVYDWAVTPPHMRANLRPLSALG